jgi:hypothetical protein
MRMPRPSSWRLAGALTLAAAVAVPGAIHAGAAAIKAPYAGPTADVKCDKGSRPEATQGRVSHQDIASGRAALGYTCNARMVSHVDKTGGFRVLRYVDKAGHPCAFWDTTLLFPANVATNAEGPGVYVMDMSNPRKPKITTTLTTPAMLSPHESLRLNVKRGLLAADMGYPTWNPGFVDIYDVSQDCRKPVLKSSSPMGVLGHESGFAPDGRTFYVSSLYGHTLSAVDVTDPSQPKLLWTSFDYAPHGVSVSDDGNRLYIADNNTVGSGANTGLTILDVSQIQKRALVPQVPVVAKLTWPNVSIPQNSTPFTRNGHHYLLENDEYASGDKVGAARIIDIQHDKHPFVVSNMRLAVDQPAARQGDQANDNQAGNALQGYAAHYCEIPTRVNPTVVACSFILSGLRVFDISDVNHPREIAYFNPPQAKGSTNGAYAMSAPAFDLARHQIWYDDGNAGFFVVQITPNAFRQQASRA